MADKKISALDVADALGETDTFPLVQSATTMKTTLADIRTGVLQPASGDLTINPAAGDVLVGVTSQPSMPSSRTAKLFATGSEFAFLGQHVDGAGILKVCRMGQSAYVNTQNPFGTVVSAADSAENFVQVGGGSSYMQAATWGALMAAAAVNTVTGTKMLHWSTAGVRIQSGAASAASHLFHVAGTGESELLCVSGANDTVALGGTPGSYYRTYIYKTGASQQPALALINNQTEAAGVGIFMAFSGAASATAMAQIASAWDGAATTDAYLSFSTRGSDSVTEKARLTSAGNLLVGTTVDTTYEAQIVGSTRVLQISDNVSTDTNKSALISLPRYDTPSSVTAISLIYGNNNATTSTVSVGGGSGIAYACTAGMLLAAATNAVATGTSMLYWGTAGVRIESGATTAASSLFHVAATGDANAVRVDDTTGHTGLGGAHNASYQVLAQNHAVGFTLPLALLNNSAAAANTGSNLTWIGTTGAVQMADIRSGWDGAATTDSYLRFGTRGSDTLAEVARFTSDGNLLVGTTTAIGGTKLDVAGRGSFTNDATGNITLLLGGDSSAATRTTATNKYATIAVPHYTSGEQPFGLMYAAPNGVLHIGGGVGAVNAAVSVQIYAAINSVTTTGTPMLYASTAGVRIESGATTAASYLFHVAATGDSLALTVDDTNGHTGFSTAPSAGYQVWALSSGLSGAILGQESSGIGLYGVATTGVGVLGKASGDNGTGVRGEYSATSGSGEALYVAQTGTLVGNTTGPTAWIFRNPTLGAFDSTGPVLKVEDNTASTSYLIRCDKEGTIRWAVADTYVKHWDATAAGSLTQSVTSAGIATFAAAGSATSGITCTANGTAMTRLTDTGLRIQSGVASAASYLLHCAGTADSTLLCVDGANDVVGVGVVPSSSYKFYALDSSAAGTTMAVRQGSVGGGARVLYVWESGILTSNRTGATAHIYRNPTLGAFDSTGTVLQVEDATASTGDLLRVVKGANNVLRLNNTGLLYHIYDGSNYTYESVGTTGRISRFAIGTAPGHDDYANGVYMSRLNDTGLRLEDGISGLPSYLLHVAGAADTTLLCVDGANDTVSMGIAPTTTEKLYVKSSGLTHAVIGQETSGVGVYGYCTTGIGVKAETAGAGQAFYAKSSATAGQATAKIEQLDVDDSFIDFVGTAGDNATASISNWTTGQTIQGLAKVAINGTDRWIEFYDAPTA